ncbi:MAG: ferrochelatase [Bacteroidia bacterium]|nr:ferrochelatase [Bacteroidia bacterium]
MKKGILLLNLGTPDSPEPPDVATYLREFLMDERVIDVNPVWRYILVNWIIVPSRSKSSSALYKKIWTKRGSPLLFHGRDLRDNLASVLGEEYIVALGMRYRNPSVREALIRLRDQGAGSIHVLPLYPQYASSSTQSSLEETERCLHELNLKVPVSRTTYFFNDPGFIQCFAHNAGKFDLTTYDHFLFSYHGLPERHIYQSARELGISSCSIGTCCDQLTPDNERCYRAAAFATTRMLVKELGIPEGKYTTAFQSRLNNKWLKPFSDHMIREWGKAGKKRILAFSPSFVADCLETTYEVGTEYLEIFREHGGEQLDLVPSLNADLSWAEALAAMIRK